MAISGIRRQKGWWWVLFLAVLLVMTGCADIKPYQPPNHREEGPQGGIFTGPEGEWVIYRSDEPAPDGEKKKDPDQATDGQEKKKPDATPDSKQP